MKVILTLPTLNYDDCIYFFVLILSILLTIKPINFKKSYPQISENIKSRLI